MMKYKNITPEQVEAAIDRLGGQDIWDAWLRGEKNVIITDIIPLFDQNGRRISKDLRYMVHDANKKFRVDQPKLDKNADFEHRLLRLHKFLNIDTGIDAQQFKAETERLLSLIRNNFQIANILNGVYLPIILPKLITDKNIIPSGGFTCFGVELEPYLSGVANSYADSFKGRILKNEYKDRLANHVYFHGLNRPDNLIKRMYQGPVIGIYFPNPLQGFSIEAAHEQMRPLPKELVLSGIDTIVAMLMYPDILARDFYTPELQLASLILITVPEGQPVIPIRNTPIFKAEGEQLYFGMDCLQDMAHGRSSGGLLFIG